MGFRTVKARTDARTGPRHIIKAHLWEISVVTFPMRPQACQQRQGGDCRRSVNSNAGSRGIRG
ncbi:hypothetical protein [Brucella intermedia]|uniref:hypothetical protein n=1 Tax=Brucella intermedia TaxID=94625 RepID=UPI003CCE58FA